MAENVLGEGKLGRNDRRTEGVILKDAYNSDGRWVAAVLAQAHEGPRTGSPRGASLLVASEAESRGGC